MTEKLKVSREVADILDSLNRADLSADRWLRMHSEGEWVSAKSKPLNTLSLEEFATALIVGYEVEVTPHEEIEAIYKYHYPKSRDGENSSQKYFSKGYVKGVKMTLEKLGITIEGVNDNETI